MIRAIKYLLIIAVLFLFTFCNQETKTDKEIPSNPSDKIEVSIPECYELANIILAVTEYGLNDPQEVHKGTAYYNEMLKYFEPYKDHPLLKKVNYSRELWEDLLSFRTDGCAFSFNSDGIIKRDFEFYANDGHKPFDDNLALINDFAKVSKFREFYKNHKPFYDKIISNYSTYYMIPEIKQFLDSIVGVTPSSTENGKYKIILSPFVGRMNCHRDLDSLTVADFPDVAEPLMSDSALANINEEERATNLHTIFTEMDHGYVNPLSDQYSYEVQRNFDTKKWDLGSGYEGINCWNEYVTWALYDLFVDKYFPKYSTNLSQQWHYQNSSRGFFASSYFANKMAELFKAEGKNAKLENVYIKIFGWCYETGKTLAYPKIISHKEDSVYKYKPKEGIKIEFSTPMKKDFKHLSCFFVHKENGETIREFYDLSPADIAWDGEKMIIKDQEIKYPEFSIRFNWWGCRFPILSEQGVMLGAESVIRYKK
ncbi:MAG: DUF4932 domain-containing protein [Bacteroidetes bacterium]|nr:DUF4932 domain-containing protein [Bacteroidota bacterium]